jgi:thiol:disulfide interchange protein DsbA
MLFLPGVLMAAPASSEVEARAANAAQSRADHWVEGKNYFSVDPATDTVDDRTIVEFFSFGCIACYEFHRDTGDALENIDDNVRIEYEPLSAIKRENWPMLQRAYFAGSTMHAPPQSIGAMYDAVWKSRRLSAYRDTKEDRLKPLAELPTITEASTIYAGLGVSAQGFLAAAHSVRVEAQMLHADLLARKYGVTGTPTLIIGGKYRIDVESAGGYRQMIDLAKWLLGRVPESRSR